MYLPKHFQVTDAARLHAFIQANSFATLVSLVEGSLFATHLPLLLEKDAAGDVALLGHVAVGNKHHATFDGEHEALAVFSGPHAYISPAWYEESPAVPTWNYTVVHAYGHPIVVDDPGWLSGLVDRLTAYYDPEYADGLELPDDYKTRMLKGIVGFRMPVARLEGKFKLSQNRSEADRAGVIEALGDHELASMMREVPGR